MATIRDIAKEAGVSAGVSLRKHGNMCLRLPGN